jgi:hypothetical protein
MSGSSHQPKENRARDRRISAADLLLSELSVSASDVGLAPLPFDRKCGVSLADRSRASRRRLQLQVSSVLGQGKAARKCMANPADLGPNAHTASRSKKNFLRAERPAPLRPGPPTDSSTLAPLRVPAPAWCGGAS